MRRAPSFLVLFIIVNAAVAFVVGLSAHDPGRIGLSGESVSPPPLAAPQPPSVDSQVGTEPTLLRVTTNPAVPGKISVDGVPSDEWGLTWLKIPGGGHEVSFGDVYGFGTPNRVWMDMPPGETVVIEGRYERWGSLRVTTEPALPATIYVDGWRSNEWGFWRALPPGPHTVWFGDVAGYREPEPQTVEVRPGELTHVIGRFTPRHGEPGPDPTTFGLLRVTTHPAIPATIRIDDVPRDEWSLNWLKLPPGLYIVSFRSVYGFTPPSPVAVQVRAGQTAEVRGEFTEHGSLRVITDPPVPATISVDGVPRNDWGMWQSMPPGTYDVSFGDVAGFTAPAPQRITVAAGVPSTVVGSYVVADAWRPASTSRSPPARMDHDLVDVGPAGRLMTFGGRVDFGTAGFLGDGWSYDASADVWSELPAPAGPSARSGYGLAYDRGSDRVVLFGGTTASGPSGETWTFDPRSGVWIQMSAPKGPSPRWNVAMTYDAGSDRIVLFGGDTDRGETDETWTYDVDADAWTRMRPTVAPSPRFGAAMTYDTGSDRSVLFGGWGPSINDDTWTYDADADRWSLMAPAIAPRFRYLHAMTYDAATDRVLLYGGATIFSRSPEPVADTWAYDLEADAWTDLAPASRPPRLYGHGLAYDPVAARTILFGGFTIGTGPVPSSGVVDETWSYDSTGNGWVRVSAADHPSARWGSRSAYDARSDRVVLFGGRTLGGASSETWTYDVDADRWDLRSPAVSPPPREFAGMAYDEESDRIVLFAGSAIGAIFGDTWTYDADLDGWMTMSPSTSPSVRAGPAMAYDSRADRVILFGGDTLLGPSDETWAYDTNTNTWSLRSPATRPPGRSGHGMAYDGSTGRTVLFGGSAGSTMFGDTWAYDYDRDAWMRVALSGGPDGREMLGLAYDGGIARTVLFGGRSGVSTYGDTWWYDAATDTWSERVPALSPPARSGHALAYDSGSDRLVLFGGSAEGVLHGDTWLYSVAGASPRASADSAAARSTVRSLVPEARVTSDRRT